MEVNAASSVETREIAAGLDVKYRHDVSIVGLDIDLASQKLDLSTLEASALSFRTTKAA